MKVELAVAIIAGVVALVSAAGTIWSSIRNARHSEAIERLKIEHQVAAQRREPDFREPLARAAYDLQSLLYNILRQNLIDIYLVKGNDREKTYVTNNTTFLIGQYLCWREIVRREVYFIDLWIDERRDLLGLQDTIDTLWETDAQPSVLRIFVGEQRAVGEALIQTGARGPECMGYGAFLKSFDKGVNPLIDAIRTDVMSLDKNLSQAAARLTNLQNALIDLLKMLDPDYLRFPQDRRTKV